MNEPLSITAESSAYIVLKITGALSSDRLEALQHTVQLGQNTIKDLYEQSGTKVRILLDMSEFNGEYDVEALEAMVVFAKSNEPYVARTAGFGGPDKSALATDIVAAMAERENINFFSTKEEAVSWLEQK